MHSDRSFSSHDRNRALERLRSLTTGFTVAGVTATLGFGWLAAATNPGQQAVAAATRTSSDETGGTSATSATGDTSSSSTSDESLPTVSLGQASGAGSAHATSGGS